MATETVSSDHSAPSEEVEKEVAKKMEAAENVSPPPKECVESTKTEESPPCAAEEKVVIEPPVIQQDVKDTNVDERPKAVSTEVVSPLAEEKIEDKQVEPPPSEEEEKAEVAAPLAKSTEEEKVEDKPIEPPPADDQKKTVDAPIGEASDEASSIEPTVEKVYSKKEEKSEPEYPEKQEETKVEPIEEKPEETAKVVDVPESLLAEEKEGKAEEELPVTAKVVEAIETKDVIVSETESKPQETSEPPSVTEQKPPEQSEATQQIKKETPEAEPVEQVELKSPTDKVEDTKLPEGEEIYAVESSDQVKSKAPISQVEEKHVESYPTGEGNELTEPAKETIEVTGLLQEKAVEPGKNEAEAEAPEEKSVVAEELVQCEEKPTDDAQNSVPQPELAEEVAQDEATSRNIELDTDNGNNKDETIASAETTKAEVEVVKGDEEAIKELEKTKAEEKIEQSVVQATEAKLEEVKQVDETIEETLQASEAKEEEKQVNEPAKTDVQNPERTKDIEDTKISQDVRKEDVPVKTQKQSIVKIVKQSLVKAKKAIIGKSQNSKTPASEPKDDGNK